MTTATRAASVVLQSSDLMRLRWHALPGATRVNVKILSMSDGEIAGLLLVEPDGEVQTHVHEGGDHHMYVLEGRCWFGGNLLVEGAYVRVPAHTPHSLLGAGPSGCRLLYVATGGALVPPAATAMSFT